MKYLKNLKYLLAFGTLTMSFFSQANAFFVEANIFESLEKKISLQVENEQVSVSITEKIRNKTEVPQSFLYFFPLHTETESDNIQLFVEGALHPSKISFGIESQKILEEKTQKFQEPLFYSLYKNFWKKLITSEPILIPGKEFYTLKLKYQFPIDFLNDVFFTEIFVGEGIQTKNFEIDLVIISEKKTQHDFLLFPHKNSLGQSSEIEAIDGKKIWHFQQENFTPRHNLKFFFSYEKTPELRYSTENETYFGDFLENPKPLEKKKINILIDQTGSMYPHWEKATEVVSEFLTQVPESAQIKIYFWDATLRPFSLGFEPNTPFNQSQVLGFMQAKKPIGKTNYSVLDNFLFPKLEENLESEKTKESEVLREKTGNLSNPAEADISFFVGDFKNFILPKSLKLSKTREGNTSPNLSVLPPIFMLDFGKNNFLKSWIKIQNGRYLEIFSDPKFIKKEAFVRQFKNWYKTLSAERFSPPNKKFKSDFLPEKHILDAGYQDEFFISRKFEKSKISHQLANFLPHLWGQRRLRQILRNQNAPYTPETLNSIKSIQRRFGISFDLKNWENADLEQKLKMLENLEIPLFFDQNIKFQGDRPFYRETDEGEDFWVAYDFYDIAHPDNTLMIKTFGETQKMLFTTYPKVFEGVFGWGKSLKFCIKDYRCLVISSKGKENFERSDLLFWHGKHLDHWGNKALKSLLNKKIIDLERQGSVEPNKDVTRGEFVRWVVQYHWPELLETPPDPKEVYYKDLKSEDAVKWAAIILTQKGIVQGYKDQIFHPERPISRAESLKILLATKNISPPEKQSPTRSEDSPFDDITGWTEFWVLEGYKRGWVKGFANKKFKPHKTITRAEGAQLLMNVFP